MCEPSRGKCSPKGWEGTTHGPEPGELLVAPRNLIVDVARDVRPSLPECPGQLCDGIDRPVVRHVL